MKSVRFILLIIFGLFVLYVKLTTGGTSGARGNGSGVSNRPGDNPSGSDSPGGFANDSRASFLNHTSFDSPSKACPTRRSRSCNMSAKTARRRTAMSAGARLRIAKAACSKAETTASDVDPHNGQRNAERLIIEWNTKKAWYTGDHYHVHPGPVIASPRAILKETSAKLSLGSRRTPCDGGIGNTFSLSTVARSATATRAFGPPRPTFAEVSERMAVLQPRVGASPRAPILGSSQTVVSIPKQRPLQKLVVFHREAMKVH
jgi:hypothetical protein